MWSTIHACDGQTDRQTDGHSDSKCLALNWVHRRDDSIDGSTFHRLVLICWPIWPMTYWPMTHWPNDPLSSPTCSLIRFLCSPSSYLLIPSYRLITMFFVLYSHYCRYRLLSLVEYRRTQGIASTGFPLFWMKTLRSFQEFSSPMLEFSRCFSVVVRNTFDPQQLPNYAVQLLRCQDQRKSTYHAKKSQV